MRPNWMIEYGNSSFVEITDDLLVLLPEEDQKICMELDMEGFQPYAKNGKEYGTFADNGRWFPAKKILRAVPSEEKGED